MGYRVNSKQATDFRIWATNTLKEYIKKGFVLNDELLKNGPKFGKDYFDYIEDLVERENTFTMEDFAKSINEFLEFRKYDFLKDNGKISRKQAEEKAEKEYNEFNKNQKIVSDFDKLIIEANRLNNKK